MAESNGNEIELARGREKKEGGTRGGERKGERVARGELFHQKA